MSDAEKMEKAIEEFYDNAFHESLKPNISYKNICIAFEALINKVNKENGCEYCTGVVLNIDDYSTVFECGYNFCPMCGRKLVEG